MTMGLSFPRSLHIFALFGFAVAQPLFDLLSRNADFLVAHRLRPLDLVVLVGILCLLFPGLLALVEAAAGSLHPRVGEFMHGLAISLLAGAIAVQAFKKLFGGPGLPLIVGALLVGLLAGWASCRVRPVESFLTFVWPSIVVFPALLTGRYPKEALPVTAANYPDNLFTWLSGNYELNAFERVSRICPEELCREPILRDFFLGFVGPKSRTVAVTEGRFGGGLRGW